MWSSTCRRRLFLPIRSCVVKCKFLPPFEILAASTMKRKSSDGRGGGGGGGSRNPAESSSSSSSKRRSNLSSSSSSSRVMPFSVMSYNCLCQTTLEYHRELYKSIPDDRLEWEYRWQRLRKEFHADVICLQEVLFPHYLQYYYPLLSAQGYEATYKQRSGGKDDGCAIFYNEAKFECVAANELNLNVGEGVLQRDNVAILLMLRPKFRSNLRSHRPSAPPPPSICVVTTHILFNMRRGDVKLAQLSYILAEVARMMDEYRASENRIGGVIFTGDFNLEPFSPLHDFLLRGSLKYQGLYSPQLARGSSSRGKQLQGGKMLEVDLIDGIGLTRDCRFPAPPSSAIKDAMERLDGSEAKRVVGSVFDPPNDQWPPLPSSPPPPPPPLPPGSPPPSPSSSSAQSSSIPPSKTPSSSRTRGGPSSTSISPPPPPFDLGHSSSPSSFQPKRGLPPPAGSVRHRFNFRSAYAHRRRNDENGRDELEVSTYHENDMVNVDYVLFDSLDAPHLRFIRQKSLPTTGQATRMGKLPNDLHGSDHFSLRADFCLYG